MKGKIDLLISKTILAEYVRIIDELAAQLNALTLGQRWTSLIAQNTIIIDAPKHHKESRDSDDDKFIDCAIAGKANFLISGDKDLLDLRATHGIPIILPVNFLKKVH